MANAYANDRTRTGASLVYGPSVDTEQSGTGDLTFPAAGSFAAGDWVTLVLDVPARVKVGPAGTVTTATSGKLPAGVYSFAVRNGEAVVVAKAVTGTLAASCYVSSR